MQQLRSQIRLHPRLAGLAAAFVGAFLVLVVLAVRSHTPDCSAAPPLPNLPPQLRALGDFDQAYDDTVPRSLADAARAAASALHPDLAADVEVGAPVEITAADPSRQDAIVFPLELRPGVSGPTVVEGLAVFLRACGDEAYFSTVADLAAAPPPAFPRVSRSTAAQLLGTDDPELVYTTTPLQPRWQNPQTGASMAAT